MKKKNKLSLASKIAQQSVQLIKSAITPSTLSSSKGKLHSRRPTKASTQLSLIRKNEPSIAIKKLTNMLSNKISRDAAFNCTFPKNIQIRANQRYIDSPHGLEFDIDFEAHILISFGSELAEFILLQKRFDHQLLNSDTISANFTLEEIFHKFGFSNWYISSKLNLLHAEEDNKKTISYRKEILKELDDKKYGGLSEAFINYSLNRCDNGISYDRYSFSIQHQTEEYRLSKNKSSIEQIYFAHFYSPERNYEHFSSLICSNSTNNIIDRYLSFRRILISCFLENTLPNKLKLSLTTLYEKTNDDIVGRLLYEAGFIQAKTKGDDILFIKICDMYVHGNYKCVAKECATLLKSNPTMTSAIEIYIKALIRLNEKTAGETILDKLINNIYDLYSSQNKVDKIKNLQKAFLRLQHCDWAFFLKLQCSKFDPLIDNNSIEKLYNFLDIICSSSNPFSKLNRNRSDIDPSTQFGIVYNAITNPLVHCTKNRNLEEGRCIKLIGDYYFDNNEYTFAIEEYTKLSKIEDDLYKTHALSRLVSCHLNNNHPKTAIHELSKLIKESLTFHLLPIAEVARYILSEDSNDLNVHELIERATVIHGYNLITHGEYSHNLTLLCENILELKGVESPIDIVIDEETLYLYEQILKPEIIETFDMFDSYSDVFVFRVIAIQNIINYKKKSKLDKSHLKNELFRTIEKLAKENCVIECGTGRVEVDTTSIKSQLNIKLSESYQSLYTYDQKELTADDLEKISINSKSYYTIGGNLFFSKILEVYYKIRDEYTLHPVYGLDNFLNMNIRHGGIINLLWGPIKQHKLSYLKNDKGHYDRENYWHEQYLYVRHDKRPLIDQAFINFTKSIDKEIQSAKNWIHINTGEFTSEDKAFNYFVDVPFIEELVLSVKEKISLDEFLSLIFNDLNKQTDNALIKIKELIESKLRKNFERHFETLHKELKSISKFDDLLKKIRLAQRECNDKVTELVSWMEWKNESSNPFMIGASLTSSLEMAKSLHPGSKVELAIKDSQLPFLIKGDYFRRFTIAFLILIDNAIIHSGITHSSLIISVELNDIQHNDEISISLSNPVNHNNTSKIKYKLSTISNTINDNYIIKANTESGSGLFKIKKIFTDDLKIKNNIEASVCDKNNYYRVTITIEKAKVKHEYSFS